MRFADFSGRPNNGADHQVVTIGATVQTLAEAGAVLHSETRFVRVAPDGADVRFVFHGTVDPDPATSTGEILFDGEPALLSRAEFESARWKRNEATDAKIQLSQFVE